MGYAWGSRTAIAELQGRPPSREPEAELWLGAHAKAPSRVARGVTLDQLIASDPTRLLGAAATQQQNELPFLLKVLAAAEPLSLQVHPSFEQARNGYAREEALGIDLTAPERNYKDPNPKPELVCALTPFTALSGFLPWAESAEVLRTFGLDDAAARLSAAEGSAEILRRLIGDWLRLDAEGRDRLMPTVREHADRIVDGPHAKTAAWVRRLAALHGNDPGILVVLLLQRYELEPLQALALDAGNLHAYLEGVAIEIMASSDNVLRGGLTPKHVDVAELLSVLRFDGGPRPIEPTPLDAERSVYSTQFSQFSLERHLIAGESARFELSAPTIALVVDGELTLRTNGSEPCVLARGESVFVGADEGFLQWSGHGAAFVASVPHEVAS